MSSPRLFSSERRWLIGAASLVLGLASLPYLLGVLAAGPDRVFSGLQVNPLDGVSYLAKMRIGYDGSWLFRLSFTPEQGQGVFLFTYFITLGHLARILGLSLIAVFHAARLLGGFALLWLIYLLIARVADTIDLRRRAWWIVALSSGAGWLAALLGHADSADLTIPESNTFYSLMANAHFAAAMALMLGMFLLVLDLDSAGSRSFPFGRIAALSAMSLALAIIQPFAPVTVYAVLGLTLLALWRRNARLPPKGAGAFPRLPFLATLMAGAITAPLMIYLYTATQADAVLQAWSQQNQTPSPPPLDYVLGYGLLWIFAFFGARLAWRRKRDWDVLLLVWIGVTLLLLYAPFPLQRRFALGLHIPIGILAAIGLTQIVRAKWPRRVLIGVTLLTSLFLELVLAGGALTRDPRIYLTADEAAALAWLQTNAPHDAVVLASPEMGAFIPAFTGQRVVYGHPFETVDADRRKQQVHDFFTGTIDQVQLLQDDTVTYIIVGPRERDMAAVDSAGVPAVQRTIDLAGLPLEEVFSHGEVAVYRVKRDA
jgi:hypothetical protein